MADGMKESVAEEVELVLRQFYGYTKAEIADVWQKQRIPNRLVNGRRRADLNGALDYLKRMSRKK